MDCITVDDKIKSLLALIIATLSKLICASHLIQITICPPLKSFKFLLKFLSIVAFILLTIALLMRVPELVRRCY